MHSKCLRQSLRHSKPSTDVNIMNLHGFFSQGNGGFWLLKLLSRPLYQLRLGLTVSDKEPKVRGRSLFPFHGMHCHLVWQLHGFQRPRIFLACCSFIFSVKILPHSLVWLLQPQPSRLQSKPIGRRRAHPLPLRTFHGSCTLASAPILWART